ncbi:hypothetical protein H4R26_000272 [Coemansia thaxteri]|uniref:BZIP domain-containing protein n=1 Tax=Coemansia thaxteri TaxID=2663907 RepID=A0A9W8EHN6_9FUNG|nr:hypothetical protein H4R26_000272 [Coemansia thaxteri]KAJ2487738.1 hypothetical protein EV174_000340 [Coemansia sp. RSA 2320]
MDGDSFDAFINQSLVDSPSTCSNSISTDLSRGGDAIGNNELLLQLLMSVVGPTTIDPSSLTSGSGVAEENAFMASADEALTAALFSALDSTSSLPAMSATPPADMHGDEAMLVDSPKKEIPFFAPAKAKAKAASSGAQKQAPPKAAAAAASASGVDVAANNDFDDLDLMNDEDMEGIDLKSLSSKERRQLRNKISARNFRVRRKEYISNLEAEVRMHKEEADKLRSELAVSRKDNTMLREEMHKLRHRLGAMGLSTAAATANSGHVAAAAASAAVLTRPAPPTAANSNSSSSQPSPQVAPASVQTPTPTQSPAVVRFNPHKDIGQAGAGKKDGNWAAKSGRPGGFIAVNTAAVPVGHDARLEQLVADAQRRRAVDALLSIGEEEDDKLICQQSDFQQLYGLLEMLAGAAMLVGEVVASQVALESSFAASHGSSPIAVAC